MGLETLSISVSDSIFRSGSFIRKVSRDVASYSQVISRVGGYDEASFTINDNQPEVEKWFTDGVGRHIEVFNSFGIKIWEGFVNSVDITIGNLSTSTGQLTEVVNRLSVKYSVFIASVNGVDMQGATDETSTVNDINSQSLFGIRHRVGQTGGISEANVITLRDQFINDLRYPKTTPQLTTGSSVPSATINCKGYFHLLDYPFISPSSADQNISDKIIELLQAEPNGFVSSNLSNIVTNTTPVDAEKSNGKEAKTVIQDLVDLGDASGNFYEFGLYNDRTAFYNSTPTTFLYQQKLKDQLAQRVTNLTGKEILPWNVRPAQWLLVADFLIGKNEPENIQKDPRAIFIESVVFTSPWSVLPRGGKQSTTKQALNRLGLGGIGL